MKKIIISFITIFLFIISYQNVLSKIIEGHQYIKLNHPINNAPELLEFFSFYCPHCYQFEQIYHASNNIKKKLTKNVNLTKYHVNFLGNLGKQLTQAWSIAIILGIEDQISPLLFSAIQKKQKIHTEKDIRSIFIQFGINSNKYDTLWNSSSVKSLMLKQENASKNFKLKGVPSIFINGKYMIKNEKLDISSINAYMKQFYELLNILLEKNELDF